MIKTLNFKAGSLKPQRWLVLALTLLTLSLIVGGCGQSGSGVDTAAQDTAVQRIEAAADRGEAAVKQIEAAAQQAQIAARRVEAAAEEAKTIAQQVSFVQSEVSNDGGTQTTVAETEEAGTTEIADNAIKIGVVVTLEGIYANGGKDALRAVEMAIAEFDGQINGRPIETIIEGTDAASTDMALNAVRKLIEEDQVDIVIGPVSSDEGLIIRDYSKDHPNKTFLNGTSAAQDITLRDPSPNFFRFSTDGVQWMAGLGDYVYHEKGYRRIVTLADDYSFTYTQVGGFLIDFCQAGGEVVEKFWTPIGTTDYSSVIEIIPPDIDAIYVALGGTDSLNFIQQFDDFGRHLPIIAGSVTLDQSVLNAETELADYIVGTPSAGPVADNNPNEGWQKFVVTYREMFPDGLPSPSLFANNYYRNTKAALLALQEVNGDLSDDQRSFQEALRNLEFDSPTGHIRLDENRQAIGSNFITEVARNEEGKLYNKFIKEVKDINQTLGLGQEVFVGLGVFSPNNPLCEDIHAVVTNASGNE